MSSFDVAAWREQFPVTREWTYLDLANKCPLPSAVFEAWQSFLKETHERPGWKEEWRAKGEALRAKIAKLIGATPAEIAFTQNTSDGLNLFANAIDFAPGDNIVVHAKEHPNNLYPWLHLRRKGVDVRIAKSTEGKIDLKDLVAHIDRSTRLVAVSWVSYCTGTRINLRALSTHCRANDALLVVDGIQGVGILEMSVVEQGIDMMACGPQKGLLSTHGIGFLYCRQSLAAALTPAYVARSSLASFGFDEPLLDLAPDARRFEHGNQNYGGIYALDAAIDLIESIGISAIESRVLHLSGTLIDLLTRKGIAVITPADAEERGGIVVFATPHAQKTYAELKNRHIIVSVIDDDRIRVAPHFYNTEEELERLVAVV
ncbi:MAG: aminotransferase class V-fold PLP-dependent enzyme [Gammaproteobacteria bacterium]|nr:aminotransferase class V-fold PLP-dependent enzyme [Gammaproteobacteria bacterium]